VEELQLLPGIGPALAQRIVAARKEQMFTSLDDLVRVRGIGEATIERLRARVVVGRAAR
jgi:competence ComEA-like helix-hairpin-helix protein